MRELRWLQRRTWTHCAVLAAATDKIIVAVFHQMIEDMSGLSHKNAVRLRDMLNAFSQVTSKHLTEQVQFYFSLYDHDGSGSLDKSEVRHVVNAWLCPCPMPTYSFRSWAPQILHMLLSSVERTNKNATQVLDLLAVLDKDGDGTVTYEEFMDNAFREPIIMSTLEAVFNVRGNVSNMLSVTKKGNVVKLKQVRCGYSCTCNLPPVLTSVWLLPGQPNQCCSCATSKHGRQRASEPRTKAHTRRAQR